MGRWINKISPQSTPSKPSKPSFVGFDGSDSRDIQGEYCQVDTSTRLIPFIQASCKGMGIDPQLVIEDLLSVEDGQDILDGFVTIEQLNYGLLLV